jgi:hypothetical protein
MLYSASKDWPVLTVAAWTLSLHDAAQKANGLLSRGKRAGRPAALG